MPEGDHGKQRSAEDETDATHEQKQVVHERIGRGTRDRNTPQPLPISGLHCQYGDDDRQVIGGSIWQLLARIDRHQPERGQFAPDEEEMTSCQRLNEKRSAWVCRALKRVTHAAQLMRFEWFRAFTKESIMAKMNKNQLIDAIAEGTQLSKGDVKAVIEQMATVGYKELNESGEFVIPGFAKMSVVNKPATEARSGVNPFTKEPMQFAAKPASKSVKASPLKVAKDAV